ncbi:Mth938-like domain-containing protein [Pseudooceanicola sp.]|uniref:Mth938-like domain-containing protein n=1 Tax=Pseudooceanicola sp. TaxID=1914328 RepID=UPI00261A6585|nr:Mth938-like domain-containing protein [Pseudooceanicola sp.]MDF1856875.1 Mth938-like domain-containing protein [Pseudooceanicola sp.]
MQMSEIDYGNARPIDGYGPGFFRIGGVAHPAPLLVTADAVRPWAGLDDHAALIALAGQIDVLFFGTGSDITPVPTALGLALDTAGIGVEPMASASACRTYNILLSEGRRVAVALLAV